MTTPGALVKFVKIGKPFAVKWFSLYPTAAYRAVFSGCWRSHRSVKLSPRMGLWKNGPDTGKSQRGAIRAPTVPQCVRSCRARPLLVLSPELADTCPSARAGRACRGRAVCLLTDFQGVVT
jgi:hypothetical protein